MAAVYDFVIIGDDAPSLCAAAAAAAAGARAARIAGLQSSDIASPSISEIPNFVWRRLNLQQHGLTLVPVSAEVTLLKDANSVSTFENAGATGVALRAAEKEGADLWTSFRSEMAALSAPEAGAGAAGALPPMSLLSAVGSESALAAFGKISGGASAILDDFFNDGDLASHVAAHALGPGGVGGDETGSATLLSDYCAAHGWRVRANEGCAQIIAALKAAGEQAGVSVYREEIEAIRAEGAKADLIIFGNGDQIKARWTVLASPGAAMRAGYPIRLSARAPFNSVDAKVRLSLREAMTPPAGDQHAVFSLIDARTDLSSARDEVVKGRLPDCLPLTFEFSEKGDIIASTAYAPRLFRDDDGWREWTGQDRQLLAKTMIDRLETRMPGLRANVRSNRVEILGANQSEHNIFKEARRILFQERRHGGVAAAVLMIDEAMSNG